jgi:hypothetical protein
MLTKGNIEGLLGKNITRLTLLVTPEIISVSFRTARIGSLATRKVFHDVAKRALRI